MALPWLPEFVAVDIETSGLAAQEDDLLEIAGVRFVDGEPVDRYTTTLQSGHALGQRTARMTGLTDIALAEGLPATEAVQGLDAFAASYPLVAHNVTLDREFLTRFSLDLEGVDFTDNPWWDSLELAALVFPELDSLALEHVATRLGIEVNVTHRAEADAELAGRVFSGLYAHIAEHWPPHLITIIRDHFLKDHPFGQLLQLLPVPEGSDVSPRTYVERAAATGTSAGAVAPTRGSLDLSLVRTGDESEAIQRHLESAEPGHPALLVYAPLVYPGQFQGPEKEFRVRCDAAGIPCYPGRNCLVNRAKLQLLLEGGIAPCATLGSFEQALLYAWAEMSPSGDFTRISWWVLNNYPALAHALPLIACGGDGADKLADGFDLQHESALMAADVAGVPWGFAVAHQHPFTPDHALAASIQQRGPTYAFLKPEYWPLHALRGTQVSLPITSQRRAMAWVAQEIAKLAGDPATASAAAAANIWWDAASTPLNSVLIDVERVLVDFAGSPQSPRCTTRGDECYWPLQEDPALMVQPAQVQATLKSAIDAYEKSLPEGLALVRTLAESQASARPLLGVFELLDHFRDCGQGVLTHVQQLTIVVQRREDRSGSPWWSLECFPEVARSLQSMAAPSSKPLVLYSTYLDEQDWRLVERTWDIAPAETITVSDTAPAIGHGNTVHLPLKPPGIRNLPPKKVWQNWQLGVLRRLIAQGSGRWLLVARNPQDVATLQYRLREPMVKAGWQPLFQRHDGTKGFLMREFGTFEKVIMVGTGEILQELDRFSAPPDTLALLHVPTRPPNDIACVAMQMQMGLSQDQYRDQVFFPLGVLDLKRALYNWAPYRAGEANVYLLDYKQIEEAELRTLVSQCFTNQGLVDTQPATRY